MSGDRRPTGTRDDVFVGAGALAAAALLFALWSSLDRATRSAEARLGAQQDRLAVLASLRANRGYGAARDLERLRPLFPDGAVAWTRHDGADYLTFTAAPAGAPEQRQR